MRKNYLAQRADFLAIEEALRYVWDSRLDFIFRDKAPLRATVIVSFDSEFIYLWTQMKLSGLILISCQLKNYFAYKIPHQLTIPAELQYAWHAGIAPKIEALLPDEIKNSSRFFVPRISGGLLTLFETLQKSFRRKNNPYTTRASYLATIIHEFGHVYWNQHKLWWYSNKEENIRYLKTAMKFYSNKKPATLVTKINQPVNQGIGETYAFCTEYTASSFFWIEHKKTLDKFVKQLLSCAMKSESMRNLETEDSVLDPNQHPHQYAFIIGNIILAKFPRNWPIMLTKLRFHLIV